MGLDLKSTEMTAILPLTNDFNRESLSSNSSKMSSESRDICRICHCERTDDEILISPCYCLGTMKYLHQTCLQRWIESSGIRSCELCKFEFIMHAEVKPFKQWQKLNMNGLEQRKLICSVAFNLIVVVCVIWSLCVLVDRTRSEVTEGGLTWPFWTKLVVVAIGFTVGLVFLYVQCKMYFQLCIRWRQFNQRIVIHSRNEEIQRENFSTNRNQREHHRIITVLDANDLPPFQLNSSSSSSTSTNSTTNPHRSNDFFYHRKRNISTQTFHR